MFRTPSFIGPGCRKAYNCWKMEQAVPSGHQECSGLLENRGSVRAVTFNAGSQPERESWIAWN